MPFLLDTNVVSELRKQRRASPQVLAWAAKVRLEEFFLSVLVLAEIGRGIAGLRPKDPRQAARLEVWSDNLLVDYANRILPVTLPVALRWATLDRSLPPIDALLAATALEHDLVLVTRNEKHLTATGARLLNPFLPPAP